MVAKDNEKFESLRDQISAKAEKLKLSRQKSVEVLCDVDDLSGYFEEKEGYLREDETLSADPSVLQAQLQEHKVGVVWFDCKCVPNPF
jgi:hypothetical protein